MGAAASADIWSGIIKLYLFRHAAIDQAYQGAYNGHIDLDATPLGLSQAKENFAAIQEITFDAIYCSTLQRARQTAKALDLEDIILSDHLREKSWGRHEGKSYDEVVAMEGQSYENFKQWLEVLDGEPVMQFIKRIETFLEELKTQAFENVLIITHAGVIYTIIYLLTHGSLEEAFASRVPYGTFTSITL